MVTASRFAKYGDATKTYGTSTRFYGGPFEFDYKIELWNGAILSEILNPKLEYCSWNYDRIGGCSDATVRIKADWTNIGIGLTAILLLETGDDILLETGDYLLNEANFIPDTSYATVTPAWKIKIKIKPEASPDYEDRYIGNIIRKTKILSDPEMIEFQMAGYQHQLGKTVVYRHPSTDAPATYASMTVKNILLDLLDDYVLPYTDVEYYSSDIDSPAITPENIIFDTTALSAIQFLATLAGNYEWGIDGTGYFYFKTKSSTRNWNLYPGDYISHTELEEDGSEIVNRVYLTGGYEFDEILENEGDVASTSQLTQDTTYNFGKSTTYNELMQTFTGLTRLKDLTLKMSKTGFTNLFTDGDMEASGVTDWLTYGTLGIKEKRTDIPYEGLQYIYVNPPGLNNGVYQSFSLTGGSTYNLSIALKTESGYNNVHVQIYNVTDSTQISLWEDNPKSWYLYTTQFTVGGVGAKTVQIRFYGAKFSLDDAEFYISTADDIDIWLVAYSDPSTALKGAVVEHTEITPSLADIKIPFTYDLLNAGTTYGLRIKRQGTLSDAAYYTIGAVNSNEYAGGTLYYSSDAGTIWNDLSKDAYFKLEYSTSQATYGVRSERVTNSGVSVLADGQLWANSYLSTRNYPQNRGVLKMISSSHCFEREKPIGLLSVRSASGTQTDYQIGKISYLLIENGLEITLELGISIPKIADYLSWIEYQLEQLRS